MHYFFLSYSSSPVEDPYLEIFLKELTGYLSSRLKVAPEQICFRDKEAIHVGEPWPLALAKALATSRVFLALYTGPYFHSENCGKEWHVFRSRVQRYLAGKDLPMPPGHIIPVLWFPQDVDQSQLPAEMRPEIEGAQEHHGDLGTLYTEKGLEYLIRMNEKEAFQKVVTYLADRVKLIAEKHALPDDTLPDWHLTPSFFHRGKGMADPVSKEGPKIVEFYVVAATADQMTHIRQQVACYGFSPREWKPFYPACQRRAVTLAQEAAAASDFESSVHEAGPDLIDRLRAAKKRKNLAVLLVDAWAVHLPEAADRLRKYDEFDSKYAMLIIPWNNDDSESQVKRERLEDLLRGLLEAKYSSGRCLPYPNSEADLKAELTRYLCEMHNQIVTQAPVARIASGNGPISRPQLTGPGGW